MLQFYFLSVLSLLVGGAALIWGSTDSDKRLVRQTLAKPWMRISVASVAAVTAVIKLFVRAPGDTVAVAGDLLPVLVGLAVAGALGVELWAPQHGPGSGGPQDRSQADRSQTGGAAGSGAADGRNLSRIRTIAKYYRVPVGIAAMAAGVVHFFVPGAVIL